MFLHETLESRKGRRDWGILFGQKIVDSFNNSMIRLKHLFRGGPLYAPLPSSSGHDQLRKAEYVESTARGKTSAKDSPLSYRSVLTKQTVLFLTSYTLLATHTAGFEQIVPVLL